MTNINNVAAIVLAAGKGTRMHAKNKNKVAFKLNGQPMITHAVENLHKAGVDQVIVVVGFQAESVREALGNTVTYVEQAEQLGTGHAIRVALPALNGGVDTVLSVYGDDSAFYPPELYESMAEKRRQLGVDLLFLTVKKDDPTGLGRIVRDTAGKVLRIVEEKNATESEKAIKEINTGFYCFSRVFLEKYIDEIQKNSVTGEYYLTDMVEIALHAGCQVEALCLSDSSVWQGVNNRSDFARAQKKAHEQT